MVCTDVLDIILLTFHLDLSLEAVQVDLANEHVEFFHKPFRSIVILRKKNVQQNKYTQTYKSNKQNKIWNHYLLQV